MQAKNSTNANGLKLVCLKFLIILTIDINLKLIDCHNIKNIDDMPNELTNYDNVKTTVAPIPDVYETPPSRQPTPQVLLNKCCHLGEFLDVSQNCVAGSSERWVPLIFLIGKRRYYGPQGTAPKFITFKPNVRPSMTQLSNNNTSAMSKEITQTECKNTNLELFSGSGKFVLFSNGSLYVGERGLLVEPNSYCVDHDAALVCFPQQHKPLLKVKKCCGKYGSYDTKTKKCIINQMSDGKLRLPSLNENMYSTVYGLPECVEASSSYAIAGNWKEAQLNIVTGQLSLPHKNLTSSEYCLEHLQPTEKDHYETPSVKIFACSHHFTPNLSFDDLTNDTNNGSRIRQVILHFGIIISVAFLGATLVAGYMMPSVHHALHWRCQIYYVFCLFIGKLLLAYSLLSDSLILRTKSCVFVAIVMHFFFLSAFFWLNTMCFNIWWTFRDFRPSSLERNHEILRLRLYSAYAWGIPLIICCIGACIDQLKDTQLLRPGFGELNCWFNREQLSIFAYFFGPIGILLCANIVLFLSTTHQLTCGLWKRDDMKSTTEKTALGKVCLKLVVVMGVTWIIDVISALIGGPESVWFITDLINALQGVFIFTVVGCQPQVWTACKHICCPRLRHDITNTTNGVQHSSSSQGLPSMGACGTDISQNTSMTTVGAPTYTSGNGNNLNVTSTIVAQTKLNSNTLPPVQLKIPMETMC